jgi:hypothetical protein
MGSEEGIAKEKDCDGAPPAQESHNPQEPEQISTPPYCPPKRYWHCPTPDRILELCFAGAIVLFTFQLMSSSKGQLDAMRQQTTKMQGQLDAMVADQRPWIASNVAVSGVRFFDDKTMGISFNFKLINFGRYTARNIQIIPEVHPIKTGPWEFSDAQKAACQRARKSADQDKGGGVTIFPGEISTIPIGTSVPGLEIAEASSPAKDRIVFAVFGCIDYTFSSMESHGQTGFRFILGRRIDNSTDLAGIHPHPGIIDPTELALQYDWTGRDYTE